VLGMQSNGNTFTGCQYSNQIYNNINVSLSVTGNSYYNIKNGYGININNVKDSKFTSEIQDHITICSIERNYFNTVEGYYAMYIQDTRRSLGEPYPMLVLVKNNNFVVGGGAYGIDCWYLEGAVIRNNQFRGSSTTAGVRIGGYIVNKVKIYNENGLLLGNNFSNFTPSTPTSYSVILNVPTRNWSIVGGDVGESIRNLGENNLITGMNIDTSEVPLGQTITDNLEDMREGMKDAGDF
jgi:hypothetical protein